MEESEVKYCRNCRRNVASQNFVSHSLHCEKHIHLCGLCKEPVSRLAFETHLEEYHKIVNCDYCNSHFERWKLKNHQTECTKMPVPCKYCEKKFGFYEASDHEMQCGSRTKKCDFCDMYVQFKDNDSHQEICQNNKLPKRMVSCEYCSLALSEQESIEHRISCGSRTEKCNTCNKFVMFKDKRNHEVICEKNNYLETMILCEYCELKIPCDEYPDHKSDCKFNWVKCPACSDFISRKKLKNHEKECKQIKCGRKQGVLCKHCKLEFPPDVHLNHESNCDLKVEQCYRCNKFVKIKDFDFHRISCSKDNFKEDNTVGSECSYDDIEHATEAEYMDSIPCSYCSVPFPHSCFSEHTETCEERIEKCLSCMSEVKFKDKVVHKIICNQVDLVCKLCNVQFPADYLVDHTKICMEGTEICPSCELPVLRRDIMEHREKCEMVSSYKSCPICYEMVLSSELKTHYDMCIANNSVGYYTEQGLNETYRCIPESMDYTESTMHSVNTKTSSKQFKPCPYCSGMIIERLLDNHKMFCQNALKVCPLCDETFHIEKEQIHTKSCPMLKEIETSKFSVTGLSGVPSSCTIKQPKGKKFETCNACQLQIPKEYFKSHLKECPALHEFCIGCSKRYHINNKQKHMKCLRNSYLHSGYVGVGAKQKRPDLKEEKKTGVFSGILSKIWHRDDTKCMNPQEQRKYDDQHVPEHMQSYNPSIETLPTYSTRGADYRDPQFSSEVTYVPCEFCEEKILIDDLIMHESGCGADLFRRPQSLETDSPVIEHFNGNLNLNTNRECLTQGSTHENFGNCLQNHSVNKPSLSYETLPQEKESKKAQENKSYMKKFNEQYGERSSLLKENNKSNKSLYSTVAENIERNTSVNAKEELYVPDTDKKKNHQFNHSHSLKNDHSELELNESKESYSYTKNMDQEYNMKNYLSKDYLNEDLGSEKARDPIKIKELSYHSSNFHANHSENIASNESQEKYFRTKQRHLYNDESRESKSCPVSSDTNESLEIDQLCPSKVMTKPGEFLNEDVHVEQFKSTSDVSPLHSKKSGCYSITGENSSNQGEVDNKRSRFSSTWLVVDSDIVEVSQQFRYQKLNHESEEITSHETAKISGANHFATGNHAKADGSLENNANVRQADIKNARIGANALSCYSRSESINLKKIFEGKSKLESNRCSIGVHADDDKDYSIISSGAHAGEDNDYSIITSSEIKGPVKIDRLLLKRKQIPPIDVTEDNVPNQNSRNVMDENFDHYLRNRSSINRPGKNEYQNSLPSTEIRGIEHQSQYQNVTSLNSTSDLFIPNANEKSSNEQLMVKDNKNNDSSYHKFVTKNFYPQMNDLSVMHVRGKNYHEFNEKEHSEIKNKDWDSCIQFLSLDTGDRQLKKSCNVCENEICVCEIKKSVDSIRQRLAEKPENKDFYQFYKKTDQRETAMDKDFSNNCSVNNERHEKSADAWNKWRKPGSDSE